MKWSISEDVNRVQRKRYCCTTSNGLQVELSTLGAAIQNIALDFKATKEGAEHDWRSIVLSYPDGAALEASASYAGRTLAPNAGRIRDGKLNINGRIHTLSPNEGQHQLHGGKHNLSFIDWKVDDMVEAPDYVKLSFSMQQPDGLDGFPGNRCYHVHYKIEDTNWIFIEYAAESDRPSYVNLSNHSYWNLRGMEPAPAPGSGLLQELEIAAHNVVLNDAASLPTDIVPVAGTSFDFRVPVSLQHMLDSEVLRDRTSTLQFQTGRGYNNAYILTRADLRRHLRGIHHVEPLKKACTLRDPVSGHQMTMMTDAPALVLYSGGFLDCPGSWIALEAQDIPDVGNLLPERMELTTPEAPFHREIRFKIS